MNILNAATIFLENIHDPTKRQANLIMLEGVLLDGKNTTEGIGKASSYLLDAVQKETDRDAKSAIFWVLEMAVTYTMFALFGKG